MEATGRGHGQPRDFGDDGTEAAVSKTFFKTREEGLFIARLSEDHPCRCEAGLFERGSK
jgi:hypothetical protein